MTQPSSAHSNSGGKVNIVDVLERIGPGKPPEFFSEVVAERDRYREALEEIASRPTVERNPDGDDQAAHTMQMIAREALDA